MIKYLNAIEGLPEELKLPLMKAFELFREEIAETVKRSDFEELKAVVKELAEAQKRTEQRVEELAEAQKRTEERLTRLEGVVEELAEAQKRTEESLEAFKKETEENFNRVWKAINELAEAQKRTEEKVEELAEAQRRTEESLNRLIKRVDMIEERLEGVSNSVGYSLENNSYRALPGLLKKEGLTVIGPIIRRYYGENQVNIWGTVRKGNRQLLLLGEVKVRPSKKEIDRFLKIAEEIKRSEGKDAFFVFVAHDYHPSVEKYLQEKGIKYYWSYEMER